MLSWSVSGSKNGIALDGDVNALAVHTNGSIYVGGNFTKTLNCVTTNLNGIARYNTAANTWSALGNNGLNGTVTALTFSGDDLFVGGDFSMTADGVTTLNRIARYNITNGTWSALTGGAMDGNGLNNSVHALAISGNNLFVGGNFTQTIGGTPTNLNRIARYNIAANTWSALTGGVMDGNGLNNSVQALTISGNNLFVGGNFTQTVGGATTTLNRIARYNTSTNVWSALANNGLNDFVRALVVSGNDLFVGGYFTETFDGTKSLNRLARYNTADNVWTAITGDADVYAAATAVSAGKTSGTDLIAGGFFTGVNCGVTHTFTRFYLQQWIVAPDSPDKLTATDWHDGANWTAGTAPAANTNAVIPASAGNVEITSADFTMNDLMLNGGTLTVGANRTLTINGILSLSGGKIYGAGTVVIANCQSDGIMNGSATGYIQTALVRCVNNAETFNFPVGTANDYSPVTVKNITGTGNISIRANQGAYSNPAIGLPANRLARWWQIENPGGGITNANLIFNYLQSDIAGNENNYKAYRITSGAASVIASSVNSSSNRLTAQNIAGFSDWTLGESAPTAASVAVSGRVSAFKGRAGISNARISITDANGATRYAITNSFGYYRFADVPAGETYIISVSHKRYRFADNPQVLTVTEEFGELNFTAQPSFQKELL